MPECAQTKANKPSKDDTAKVKQNTESALAGGDIQIHATNLRSTADGKIVAELNSEQDKEIALQQLNDVRHIASFTASNIQNGRPQLNAMESLRCHMENIYFWIMDRNVVSLSVFF